MKLNIGNRIKELRRSKEITQEEFADYLGVSYQSVSRWENGVCYPDMELLPIIADFFSVTTDDLLSVDKARYEEEIQKIIEEYDNLTDEALKHGIIFDAIKEFPNDFRIQLRYMADLAFKNNGTDFKECLPKIRAIYSNIQNNCKVDTIRICAKRYLAAYYNTLAYYENSGVTYKDCDNIISEMPYMRDGQEFLRSYLYPHYAEDWKEHTMEAVEEEISLLCHGLSHLFYVTDEDADTDRLIKGVTAEIELLNLFYNEDNYGRGWRNIIFSYGYLGYLYAKKGDYDKGVQYLKKEIELAKRFDNLERITVLHSDFFEGKEFDKHTLGSTFIACSRVKYLIEEKYPLSDEFKATPEFQEIIEMIS